MPVDFYPLSRTHMPIFRADFDRESWFYAPGYLALVSADQAERFARVLRAASPDSPPAVELLRRAEQAVRTRSELHSAPFTPTCLTLYLNNTCNLACRYCYAEPGEIFSERLSIAAIQAALPLVAAHCADQGRPLTVVFHGGGEPTLDRALVDQALDLAERQASERGVGVFRYIATNGVVSEDKAAWLARRFDLVGLSCDGPEPVQSYQRPLRGGTSSTPWVERTARLLREAGTPLHVRLTVTPASLHSLTEIAAYLCDQLKPQEIHVEPLYRAGLAQTQDCFTPAQAGDFITEFLRARQVAQDHAVRWTTSISRPPEIHGPYCHVFRGVLNLIPGSQATACFRISHEQELQEKDLSLGVFNQQTGRYMLYPQHVAALQAKLGKLPPQCAACFNQFHCTHGCPDRCPAEDHPAGDGAFRCRLSLLLAQAAIQECAAGLRQAPLAAGQILGGEVR